MRTRPSVREQHRRGFVLVMMTFSAIAVLGALGLAVDMGRVFIAKNEAQAYADAEALAAAAQLNGTTLGIDNAINAITSSSSSYNFSSTVKWNMNTCSFLSSTAGCSSSAPVAEVATASSGATWYTSSGSVPSGTVPNIRFARVTTSVNVGLFFLPVVMTTKIFSQNVKAQAVASQVDITNFTQGLAPFTGVASSTTGPNFGFTVGNQYDIQWPQYNGSRHGCNNGHPENCFVQPPCPDETSAAQQAIVQHWGASINGYWGAQSTSVLNDYIIGTKQLQAVAIGTDLQPVLSSGNKAATAKTLDDRVNSDPSNVTNTLGTYLTDSTRNGRRMIVVPIVDPRSGPGSSDQSIVVGYGQFLLISNAASGGTSNYYFKVKGNDPYCAVYAGPYNLGSVDPGVGNSTGASRVRLVQ